MKTLSVFVLFLLTTNLFAQNGYVKFDKDSVLVGYLKYYTAFQNGEQGIEFWRTKKDDNPLRIPRMKMSEYAIKKDTFRIINNYTPFPDVDVYWETATARVMSRGKVDLLRINYYSPTNIAKPPIRMEVHVRPNPVQQSGGSTYTLIDKAMGDIAYLYLLHEPAIDFLQAIPGKKNRMDVVLNEYFPKEFMVDYILLHGEIKYKDIPVLVKAYNNRR